MGVVSIDLFKMISSLISEIWFDFQFLLGEQLLFI